MTVLSAPVSTLYAARKGSRPLTAEDLWKLPRVGAPAPSPDGKAVAVPVTTWDLEKNESRTRIWWVPADGSAPRPLTGEEHISSEPSLSPDGSQLAFIRKKEKGKGQLHVMPLNGGEPRQLTTLPLGAFDPHWLPNGSGLVFAAHLIKGHLTPEATAAELDRREKDPVKAHITEERMYRFWDQWLTTGEVPHLFHYDLATDTLRDLTPESTVWFDWMEPSGQFDVSPDGSEVAFSAIEQREGAKAPRTALYVVPVAGGPITCLTPDHPADDMRPRYAPDGKTLVYGMTHDPEFYADRVRLMVFDRAARTHSSPSPDWKLSPSHWGFADDGTLILEAEEDGRASLFSWKPGPTEPKRIVRGGSITGAQPARGAIYYNQQTLMDAPEIHRAAPDGSGPRRLTTFTEPIAKTLALGEVREMYFDGAYGERVHMFVVLPPNYEEGKKYPLVHVIHGGPHGISGDGFHFRWNAQLFASPGYVAAMVNFQGSTSWGQDFAQRILGSWGDRPYKDVMLGTDHLIASGLVDENRMAASGGSYGGYMAAWIAGHTDRFKCIINHAGVYDTLSQYASDWTYGRNRSFGGEPWNGLEAIDAYNPARFAAGFKTPMLVIHGERDYRVPVTQGLECYGVLKAKGIPARLVYFPDENHWVLKARNSLVWYREVHAWLERWLGK